MTNLLFTSCVALISHIVRLEQVLRSGLSLLGDRVRSVSQGLEDVLSRAIRYEPLTLDTPPVCPGGLTDFTL